MQRSYRLLLLTYLLTLTSSVWAMDVVKFPIRDAKIKAYQKDLIAEALLTSEPKYGPYELVTHIVDISGNRSFSELDSGSGKFINLRVGVTTLERESTSIPIRIPIRKGLLNYRLLLTNKSNLEKFEHVDNITSLKKLSTGLLYDWITTGILKTNQFNVLEAPSYKGLFRMLEAQRFDYTVLGVNEAYLHLKKPQDPSKEFVVVPNIALYIDSPSYIFISKSHPRIAERIEWGMEKMIETGRFDELFYLHHQKFIEQANLKDRKIIKIPRESQYDRSPYNRSVLWFSPKER